MDDKILKELNINEILKYLITGAWSYFVYYSILGEGNPLNKIEGLSGLLILFSFGALSYHVFRSTLFIVITIAGDLLFDNVRLEDAKQQKKNWLLTRIYMISHWALLNDKRRIEREVQGGKINDASYDTWLSSIIMMYLSGVYTVSIAAHFYDINMKPVLFEKNIYYYIGMLLIISAFISQRLYEKRLLRHWEKMKAN
jgi:hypothetical protein